MPENSDHDLLIEIKTIVQELKKDLNGNGQPGLKKRLAQTESNLRSITEKQESCAFRQSEAKKLHRWAIGMVVGNIATIATAVIIFFLKCIV